MWIFTKHGFFSAVQNYNDSNLIHVRTNFEGDLERLCETYGIEPNVKRIQGSDYTYRMDFTREQWDKVLVGEAREIDYVKFKPAVHDGTKRGFTRFCETKRSRNFPKNMRFLEPPICIHCESRMNPFCI